MKMKFLRKINDTDTGTYNEWDMAKKNLHINLNYYNYLCCSKH